jgi:bifunctional DNase/RNase
MKVRGLMFDPYNNAYIVILRDEDRSDMLPIWVGKAEASSISFALENIATPRPMTHDLMKAVLDTVDAKVISVVVTDMKDNTYYSKIHLMYEDSE